MKKLLLTFGLALTLLLPTTAAFAERNAKDDLAEDSSTEEQIEQHRLEIQARVEERAKERQERLASKAAEIKEKLADVKLKVCQTRQEIIKRRSASLADRAQRQFEVFSRIAGNVETFYNDKILPRGIVVTNFDQLKEAIVARKTEAEEAINTAKTDADNFDCSADNPKEQLKQFNADMRLAIEALKDYRTSIKDLIVAVKSAIGTKNSSGSAEASGSAEQE